MKYPLIVFDWDGTIIDSPGAIVECIQAASRDMGLRIPAAEQASHVIGLGLRDSLQLAVPDLPDSGYAQFVALYRKHFLAREESMQVFFGMHELLTRLSQRHALAVATGKSRQGLDRAMNAARLSTVFNASRCADETRPKPHPAMLLELLDELCVGAEGALMIGDTSHDLEMARAAGVDALAVTYGAHPEAGLRACAPLGCVGSVLELQEWLTRNA